MMNGKKVIKLVAAKLGTMTTTLLLQMFSNPSLIQASTRICKSKNIENSYRLNVNRRSGFNSMF